MDPARPVASQTASTTSRDVLEQDPTSWRRETLDAATGQRRSCFRDTIQTLPVEVLRMICEQALTDELPLAELLPEDGVGDGPTKPALEAVPLPARVFALLAVSRLLRATARHCVLRHTEWYVDTAARARSLPQPGQWSLPPAGTIVTVRWTMNPAARAAATTASKQSRRPPYGRSAWCLETFWNRALWDSRMQWRAVAVYVRRLLARADVGGMVMDGRGLEEYAEIPKLEVAAQKVMSRTGLAKCIRKQPWARRIRVVGYQGMDENSLLPSFDGATADRNGS